MSNTQRNNKHEVIEAHPLDNNPLSQGHNGPSERTKDYVRASSAEATLRAYRADLEHFMAWGGSIPASANSVANYLSDYAGALSVATLSRRVAALSKIHSVRKLENPTKSELVRSTMKGIKRTHGTASSQVSPLTKERLIKMVETCGLGRKGIRDSALLLVGFASALRRSELLALNCNDAEFVPEGLILTIERSKTDQEGKGRRLGIPYAKGEYCPVGSLQAYIEHEQIIDGPLFRSLSIDGDGKSRLSGNGIAYIIKRRAKAAGFNPRAFSGHSLRAGLATSAAQAGVETYAIMKQTGHKSETSVRRYIREAELFVSNPISNIL
ncbi:MAG: site-specific integrase [Emcibacteraceae bacterium]